MKSLMSLSIVAVLSLFAIEAMAKPLSENDKGFIVTMTAGAITSMKCDVKVIPGGMTVFADKRDIDGETLSRAFDAAMALALNKPYEHNDIIPGVTQMIASTISEVAGEIDRNKISGCAKWVKLLRRLEILEPIGDTQ